MRANTPGLAYEMGWPQERYMEAFEEVLHQGLIETEEGLSIIRAPRFLRHNPPESPNVVRSWTKLLPDLPESDLLERHIADTHTFLKDFGEAFAEVLAEAFGDEAPHPSLNPDPFPLPEKGKGRNVRASNKPVVAKGTKPLIVFDKDDD